MSRVGKLPVKIPEKVKVFVDQQKVRVEGPKGKMSFVVNPIMKIEVAGSSASVQRPDDSRLARSLHGLTRTLLKNAIDGVVSGYERSVEISGVGFKAEAKGKEILFTLGYSHPITFKLPDAVTAEVDPKQTRVTLRSVDKHLLGLTIAKIRSLRVPEPYKGKGIKYAEETIRRKEGKTGAA